MPGSKNRSRMVGTRTEGEEVWLYLGSYTKDLGPSVYRKTSMYTKISWTKQENYKNKIVVKG